MDESTSTPPDLAGSSEDNKILLQHDNYTTQDQMCTGYGQYHHGETVLY